MDEKKFDKKLLKKAEDLHLNLDLVENDEQLEYLIESVEELNKTPAEEIDDDIDEEMALARAKAEGIEFKDTWLVDDKEFDTEAKALKAAKNDRSKIAQRREQV